MNRVLLLRIDLLLTQRQLARRAKVSLRTIYSVERGMRCRRDTQRKILRALGVPFERVREFFPASESQSPMISSTAENLAASRACMKQRPAKGRT
jgi:transcriptional regulator with XRE-family HTH domain